MAVFALIVGVLVPTGAAIAVPVGTSTPTAATGSAPASALVDPATTAAKMTLDGFTPGNIISDAVFTNKNTMSEAQIQAFFESKVSRCQGGTDENGKPIVCIKDFRITSVTRPADAYCSGYTGAPNESAARIIYRVAQACNINPQVLIVMLQKEQGLVTHTWPSAWRYNIALGQGCPDTAPCDPNYIGFFHQIYGAARQMQIYMEGRWFQWYAPGKTWNILYNPNANCGSAPVYVANKATSALYYYTPYQPNAAALRAGYGLGDGCSAYGNRNFYNYFTDWFGSTQSTGARLMKDSTSGVTYLVSGSTKYPFPSAERAVQFTWIAPLETATSGQLAVFADGGYAPRAVRTDAGNIYLLNSGRRYLVPSCARAADFAWNCNTLPVVAQAQANAYPDEGYLSPSVRGAGATWFMQGGYRREIVDTSLLQQYGIATTVSPVADALISDYWAGDPVLGAGVYSDGSEASTVILQGGATYNVAAPAKVDAVRAATRQLTSESFVKLKASGDLPLAVRVDGRSYLLSNDGWMAVDTYGASVNFVNLTTQAIAAMPQAPAALGAHFVRERSSLQIHLASGGVKPVSADEQRWIASQYGVPTTVRVVADTTLGLTSTPTPTPTNGLVRTPDGVAYLIDGANHYRLRDCSQVASWGSDCAQLAVVAPSQLGQTADRGWLDHLIRRSDGTIWLVQSGTRREVVDPSVLAPYGIGSSTTTLSNAMLDPLPIGGPVLGSGAYSDGASGMIVVNPAGTFSIPVENRLPVVTNGVRKLSSASFELMTPQGALPSRMLSDGRALILTEQGWLQVDAGHYGGAQFFTPVGPAAWSGVPLLPFEGRPHFIRERSSNQQFLVSGGAIQPVKDDAARMWLVGYFGVPSTVWPVADGALKGLSLPAGTIFRDTDARILLSDGASYYQLASCDAASALGRNCADAPTVSSAQLGLSNAGVLAPLLRSVDGALWLVQAGVRREVPDPTLLGQYGIGSTSSPVSNALIGGFPIGSPVIGSGMFRDAAGAVRMVVPSGTVLDVPAPARVEVVVAQARRLSDASFSQLQANGTLPVRAESSGSYYVLSSRGWVKVDRANYGSLAFASTPAEVIAAIPTVETTMGPRFVRETTGTQVYLASGGLTPVTAEDQARISAAYGVPASILQLAQGALN